MQSESLVSLSPRDASIELYGRDASDWDDFVTRDGTGTFCHLTAWRGVMEDTLGHETHYLAGRSHDGTLAGVLPLVHVRSRIFGNYLLSMPFLNYGGPLGEATVRRSLCAEAIEAARRLNVDLLELRSRDAAPEGLSLASRKLAVIVPLPSSAEELWESQFRSKLRNKIKRPMNQGMEVRFGVQELEPFYEIFARNMRDLGTPVLPRKWFESVSAGLGDAVIFASVYWKGIPVAAGCGFLWQDEFELSWSSTIREYNSRHPNMLLCWSLMKEAIRRGASAFNFGRSTADSNTHHFKQQWGGEDIVLPWGTWGRRAAPPNPNSTKYRIARGAWRRLPLPLSKRLGPTLARQLP